jgi:mRNA-degrading endonuclease toxin of MazEF toxin-antitoxin module
MVLDPAPGLVIKYDFLWKEDKDAGHEDGLKDRPCAIILTSREREDGSREIVLCPITQSPPSEAEGGVKVPLSVSRHLGLDDDQSWIKTHQVNTLRWEKGRLPHGVTPGRTGGVGLWQPATEPGSASLRAGACAQPDAQPAER